MIAEILIFTGVVALFSCPVKGVRLAPAAPAPFAYPQGGTKQGLHTPTAILNDYGSFLELGSQTVSPPHGLGRLWYFYFNGKLAKPANQDFFQELENGSREGC
ncbi:MAG: hypothetical protein WBB23_13660 [Desulforhopalus sp.]